MQDGYTRVQGFQISGDNDVVDDDGVADYDDDYLVLWVVMMTKTMLVTFVIMIAMMMTLQSTVIHCIWTLDYTPSCITGICDALNMHPEIEEAPCSVHTYMDA